MDGVMEITQALRENRTERAGELCHRLLEEAPDSVELLTLAGSLARRSGDADQALCYFSKAVAVNPSLPELYNNLGVILEDLGRHEEAASCYRQALSLSPRHCQTHCNLANALRALGRTGEAVESYRAAIACDPAYHDAYYNLANALRESGEWREAAVTYWKLVALKPDHLSGWINLGGVLLSLNSFEEAIEALRRALVIDPDSADAHWNLALALLSFGEYREGWREYEWRLANPAAHFSTTLAGKEMWDGSNIAGQTLLVRSEQGFGDALQFFRFIPLLVEAGIKVVLECRRELLPLFASQETAAGCFAAGEEPPPFDTFAYLMSLPHLLGTTVDSIPAEVPYLQPDPSLQAHWGERMPAGKVKVGVVWAGSATYKNDGRRSLQLRLLEPLSRLQGVELYSLQMGTAAAELAAFPWGRAARDLSGELKTFADTAAVIANLDLVITVDTAVAHLAGAMGKELFLMLPSSGEWRWLHGRSDSPWYPTARLYRQPAPGDWEAVVAAVVRDLAPDPEEVNRLFRAANALRLEGRYGEAAAGYRRLLAVRPDCAEIHNNLGLALQDDGRHAESAQSYRKAITLKPQLADAHNNLGTVLVAQGEREAAVPCFEKAISLRGDYLPAYINLGSCLQHLERPEEAVELYRRVIALDPHSIEARVNLGTAHMELMQPEQAIRVYEEALRLDPQHAKLHWNLSLALLSIGDFRLGWREYEWRFASDGIPPDPLPTWDGGRGCGQTMLLECEQGLGDTLQFVRYAPLVADRGYKVLLRCQYPSLKPLLGRVAGVAGVYARGEAVPPCDLHAPLLSLPYIFGTTMESVPAAPYLSADPERVELWRSRMAARGKLKAGLVWKGGPLPKNRACPFTEFAPLSRLSGVSFYSLQLGELPDGNVLTVTDLAGGIKDFADTAAVMAGLDLVISVDTAAAHLAGGLGVPVWLLLPYACDWRWLGGISSSPWYRSMRIFRQERPGDWSGVMLKVKQSLEETTSR